MMDNAEIGGDKQAKGSKRSVLEKRTHMFVNGAIHQVEHKGDDRLQAINNQPTFVNEEVLLRDDRFEGRKVCVGEHQRCVSYLLYTSPVVVPPDRPFALLLSLLKLRGLYCLDALPAKNKYP